MKYSEHVEILNFVSVLLNWKTRNMYNFETYNILIRLYFIEFIVILILLYAVSVLIIRLIRDKQVYKSLREHQWMTNYL